MIIEIFIHSLFIQVLKLFVYLFSGSCSNDGNGTASGLCHESDYFTIHPQVSTVLASNWSDKFVSLRVSWSQSCRQIKSPWMVYQYEFGLRGLPIFLTMYLSV